MFVQILIYVYLGICAGMILFNIVTALLSQRREHRSFRAGIRLELTVERELDHLALTGEVNEEHLRYMERRLRRVNGMAAFDAALECLCVRRPELTRSYLTALNGVMIALAEDYCRREEIEAAYFPYIIKKYRLLGGADDAPLKEVLLELLHEPSIYCRENAMQALYTAGDPDILVRALRIIDASSLYYHSKLLSDGLLNYTGDTWELADALWAAFDAFQPWMQVTLLNYFRFSSGAHCERVLALLNDGARDDELRFSCLRYLGHYPYPPRLRRSAALCDALGKRALGVCSHRLVGAGELSRGEDCGGAGEEPLSSQLVYPLQRVKKSGAARLRLPRSDRRDRGARPLRLRDPALSL